VKAQIKKEQLLIQLQETRASILNEASTLPAEKRNIVFLGVWSIRELLAHLAGWDFTNMDAIKSVLTGNLPSFYEHHDHDWRTYNAILVEKYNKTSFRELLASVKNSQKKLIELLQTIPPEYFNKDFGVRFRGYKVTIQLLLEADVKDVQVHCQQIKDFFEESK